MKKHEKYTLTYVPDAKAFTDAPDSLAVLIKQRRRWMNGALFGTMKVIANITKVLSCKRTKHPVYKQILSFSSCFITLLISCFNSSLLVLCMLQLLSS